MTQAGRVAVAIAAIVGFASLTMAHHGWSGYKEELVKLTGTIEQPNYVNPHGSIHLKTADKTWDVVLAPITRMENRGLTREMLKAGVQASVEGYQHMEKASEMRAERIILGGKTFELR